MVKLVAKQGQLSTYYNSCHIWWQLSQLITIVTCSQNGIMWPQLSHAVTIVTYIRNFPMWSQLSHVLTIVTLWSQLSHVVTIVTLWSQLLHMVTIVTCGHNCHMWSQLSHVVTHVTYSHTCQMWPNFSQETNVSTADKKVSSLSHDDETRPTYRPARTQVKMYRHMYHRQI